MNSNIAFLAALLLACLVAVATAAAPGVDTGSEWKSDYQHLSRQRRSLSQVDKIVLEVINEMTKEQTNLRNAIASALNERNDADNKRKYQMGLVNKLRGERVNAEAKYNAKRKEEQKAVNELKVREKLHQSKMTVYQKTHSTNTVEISRLDREKRILTEIRRLLGNNRSSRFTHHRDQADIKKADAHASSNYKDQNSQFNHGAQAFHGHWVELSYVKTETEMELGVNLRGVSKATKSVKFVNQGTIMDWHKQNTKTWTSFGFDLKKIVFRALDKETNKVLYISLASPYHKCGLESLAETRTDYKIMPELLTSKSGAVSTCYQGNNQVPNCWNQIVLDTTRYQPVGILDIESLGKCWTKDNALRFRFAVFGLF